MTAFFAPFSGGRKRTLPVGEVITIAQDPPIGAALVWCDPERYDELHRHFVRRRDRVNPLYSGYYLGISTDRLARDCERLSDV